VEERRKDNLEARDKVEHAAATAVSVIADAASEAAKTIAAAAATAIAAVSSKGTDDHDLMVRIDERLTGVKADILDLKTGTAKRISDLELEKLSTKDSYAAIYKKDNDETHADFEKRLRANGDNIVRIMTWGSAVIVIAGILEFVINRFFH
jgi:hypothetical protein